MPIGDNSEPIRAQFSAAIDPAFKNKLLWPSPQSCFLWALCADYSLFRPRECSADEDLMSRSKHATFLIRKHRAGQSVSG